jgi:hypothetical protein
MFGIEERREAITVRIFMTGISLFRSALALSVLALFVSCAEIETPPTTNAPVPTPIPGYWNGDGVPGSPKIVVNITRQRAYFFKGKQLVGESTVSTGKKGFSTPPGSYQVLSKDKDHVSTVFGDYVDDFGNVVKSNIDSRKDPKPPGSHYDGARMPYAMFFRGGYAMHQGYVPPYAASHGCIRVPQGMADIFFDNAPVGTPVLVKESPGETYSRIEPDQGPPSVPVPLTVPPPAPNLVRSTAPASVRPASVRSTVPAPTPVPVRSPTPTPVVSRTPAPFRSTRPSVYPTTTSVPIPVRSPSPASVRSPAPATVRPTPTPVPARHHRPLRSRHHVRSPAPSPTPTPASAR